MCNGMVKVGYSRFLSSHREREVQTFTKPLISCAKRLYITTGKHSGLRTWLIINHTASRFGDLYLVPDYCMVVYVFNNTIMFHGFVSGFNVWGWCWLGVFSNQIWDETKRG